MIITSNSPSLVLINVDWLFCAQYSVKCDHEYDFDFDLIYILCPFQKIFEVMIDFCWKYSLIIGIRLQISMFLQLNSKVRFQGKGKSICF